MSGEIILVALVDSSVLRRGDLPNTNLTTDSYATRAPRNEMDAIAQIISPTRQPIKALAKLRKAGRN